MTEPSEPPYPPHAPAPLVVVGRPSPRSSAADEYEARAARLRENIGFSIVTRILNAQAPPMDQDGWEHLIDWVLKYYLGDLGAQLEDAAKHRRRVASLKKRATAAEMLVASRLREMRRMADFYDRYPDSTTKKGRRLVDAPVATLATELQADLAKLDRDDPQRATLDEMYRIVRRGTARVLEMYDRVLPQLERFEAFMERLPPEDDPPESDE